MLQFPILGIESLHCFAGERNFEGACVEEAISPCRLAFRIGVPAESTPETQ